jgi:hypothetical protein
MRRRYAEGPGDPEIAGPHWWDQVERLGRQLRQGVGGGSSSDRIVTESELTGLPPESVPA